MLPNSHKKNHKKRDGFDSRKGAGTFAKRNAIKRPDPTAADSSEQFHGFSFTVPFERSIEDEMIEEDYYSKSFTDQF